MPSPVKVRVPAVVGLVRVVRWSADLTTSADCSGFGQASQAQ